MRRTLALVLATTAGLLLAAGCSAVSLAPAPELAVAAGATPTIAADVALAKVSDETVIAGDYQGTMVVTQDSDRVDTESGEYTDISGTAVNVLLSLLDDCRPGVPCLGEMTSLYVDDLGSDTYWELEFLAADDAPTVTLVNEDDFVDNCVGAGEQVIGTFDTTSTVTVVLSEPIALADGRMAWSTADVVYLEDSVGSSDSDGCLTSVYELKGTLERVS